MLNHREAQIVAFLNDRSPDPFGEAMLPLVAIAIDYLERQPGLSDLPREAGLAWEEES